MKSLFKWLFRIGVTLVLLLIVLLVVAVLFKDIIAKSVAERNLRDSTGMDAKISKLEVGLGTPTVNLEGLKLYNTPEFGGSTFLDLPELRVEYAPDDIRDGKLRFKTLRLHLAEVHIVKNKQGKTNLEMLQKETKKKSPRKKTKSGEPDEEIFGGVETLYLTIDRIRITDLSDPRNDGIIEVGIKDEVGKNLKDEVAMTEWFNGVLLRIALRDAFSGVSSDRERWRKVLRIFGMRV